MKTLKKTLAIVLGAAMIFSLTPAYAGEAEDGLFFFPKERCRSSLKSGLTNKR